ncbi:chaperone modulator CbpM [Gilvimarinus polysaccharolyticus]|uniref:chaperone modulator CbpM n=1 Tax=Gilvimarinus polysaccharolyticus TaxID=863921 RepID=UPI0006734A66|nr:chaperone modulator CbpM [Gilvimarinus polysaccharolyticus]
MTKTLTKISYEELCQIEGIKSEYIIDIVNYKIVVPIGELENNEWLFETTSVYWIKKALRLYLDLEIDWVAVAVIVDLMRQKEILEKENDAIQRQLNRLVGGG